MSVILVHVVLTIPALCFGIAALLEFKKKPDGSKRGVKWVSIGAGVICSVLVLIPLEPFVTSSHTSRTISMIMTLISLAVAVTGVLKNYESKVVSILVVVGGLLLAFFWSINPRVI